jgi:hypothetical protein
MSVAPVGSRVASYFSLMDNCHNIPNACVCIK